MEHPHTKALRDILAVRQNPDIASELEATTMMLIARTSLAAHSDPGVELEELRVWKESAMSVMNGIDIQEIGKEIGAKLGTDIGPQILTWIRTIKKSTNYYPPA